jgi:hypothetical protein
MAETKSEPHYPISDIQELVNEGKRFITMTATIDGTYIDFGKDDIYNTVLALKESNFYKSMQSDKNPILWHDVYHYQHDGVDILLYIKLQIKKNAVVVSFKEK